MAGAIEKKKKDTKAELEGAPTTHIDARSAILADITLSREFAHTYLQAICKRFGSDPYYSLADICEKLAEQRAICYGASSLKTSFKKFDFPTYGAVNGSLTLTEANTKFFGYVATDLAETNTITLQDGDTTATQTIDGNTFSTYVGNYYMVRSRVSGELEDISGNLSAYTTPDGGDIVFGNSIAWGSSVSGEEAANTWNYHWARANVASVVVKNENGVLELNTLTLADDLTAGSDGVDPVGPGFNQKFYLKKHADSVNTFTITGQTTVGTVDITSISDADIAKVKYGDVISGTGLPADGVSIAAVQTADSKIRLNETGIASDTGAITLTVNSVPFGHAAHDIFCQLKISAEGLVANTSWAPVGDDAGTYITGSEDDLCVADTDDFIGLLNFFNPNAAGNDLIKGASASYVSDGKEIAGTKYPYIETNAFFPSNLGTSKAWETKTAEGKTEITGTQPRYSGAVGTAGLGDKDLWSGRFIRFDNERENSTSALPEFRYLLDNAEKFYYELSALAGFTCGEQTTPTAHAMPGTNEPPAEIANKTALQGAIGDVISSTNDIGVVNNTPVVPADDAISYVANGTTAASSSTADVGNFYLLEANNIITKNYVKKTVTAGNSSFHQVGYTNHFVENTQCVYNHTQGHLYHVTAANSDVAAVETALTNLQAIDSFRDPIISGAHSGSGISDSEFDANCATHATNGPNGTLTVLRAMNGSFRSAFGSSGRSTHPTGAQTTHTVTGGNSVDYTAFPHPVGGSNVNASTAWGNFVTSWGNLKIAITARIAEIDARIGKVVRAGTPASGTANPPTVYVNIIPASNTTSGFVPYGRSLYNNVNMLLGQDVDLLGGIIKDVESLTDLIDLVKTARNKYEIYSGRDKEYS